MSEIVLETHGLTKAYRSQCVVDHVDLRIEKGHIYGLVGRNGAGKTSIIRMVTGQTVPTGGALSLFGESGSGKLERMRARTGAMVETPSFSPFLTARENLEYYRIQRGIPSKDVVEEALEQVRLTNTGKKKFKFFSLGMKQRLGLALALMNRPDLLLLDEPINGLDPEGIVEVRHILTQLTGQLGMTVLISSHILTELASLATCYGFLEQGVMLEQLTSEDLRDRCRACLEIRVDDAAKAARVLEQTLDLRAFDVLPDGLLRLYSGIDAPHRIVKVFVEAGLAVSAVNSRGANLEDYYLSLVGGVRGA
ncbi:MAG: ABC transporter ATP-binding protein [Oscillospiraceae bacterium]|nr:ABC transporter ATP-binding protein [Oscillospiraceae bacterium]